jgi:hypothetical protein
MKKKINSTFARVVFSLTFIAGIFTTNLSAQVNMYSFATSTGNTLETGGSFSNLLGTFIDDGTSAQENIGFTFNFGGVDYTDFSVTSNGLMALGTTAVTDYDNIFANLSGPYLSPYWDNNYTDADGYVQYQVLGSPGSRKLVVDYSISYAGQTGTADKRFQIWLFETTNRIMFVYGGGNDFNDGFSVGVLTNGSTDFMSISVSTNTSNVSVANDNNTTWPGSGTAYTINGSGTLPVSFLSISGYKDGKNNQLQWSTANETNNKGFEIQRSSDGTAFSVIGFVNSLAADGNSTSVNNYSFIDKQVVANRQFYRLRQVDFDNHSQFSSIVRIEGEKPLSIRVEGIFPNPAGSLTQVMIASPGKERLTIVITDINGIRVMQKLVNVEAGRNNLPLHVSQLSSGTYTVQIITASGKQESAKMVVTH